MGLFVVALILAFTGDINLIDEGQFGAWASQMVSGKVPYKDIYITYGPLYIYPLFWLSNLFSPSAFLVRLYLVGGSVLALISFYYIARQLRIPMWLCWVGIVSLAYVPSLSLRHFPVLLSLAFFLSSLRRKYIYSGVFTALSFFISPELGIFLFSIYTFTALYLAATKKLSAVIRNVAQFLVGVMIVTVPVLLFAYSNGWIQAYFSTTVDLLVTFSGDNLPNGYAFPKLTELLVINNGSLSFLKSLFSSSALLYWSYLIIVYGVFYLFVKFTTRNLTTDDRKFSLVLWFAAASSLLLISRWGVGHLLFIFPFILLVLFYLAGLAFRRFIKKRSFFALVLLLIALLYPIRIVSLLRTDAITRLNLLRETAAREKPLNAVGPMIISVQQEAYIRNIVDFTNKNTTEDDFIFFLSNEPMMYLLTQRKNPSRYDLPYIPITIEKRYELLNSLEAKSPKYIFYDTQSWAVDEIGNKQRVPEVYEYITKNYNKKTIASGRIEVFQLK